MDADRDASFVDRVSRQGEEALGRLAEELIGNPLVSGAVSRALEAREKAVQAQEAALGALNIPSAADVERVTRRLRSVSQRLESIEDTLDRLEERLTVKKD
jgi:chromosome segregation ATPase